MMVRAEITLSVTLRSPFLMPGLGAAALGIDAAALRDDTPERRPVIPADQVRGLLSAACVTLQQATDGRLIGRGAIDHLFGAGSSRATDQPEESDIPVRGALIVGDLIADKDTMTPTSFTRVCIDHDTGAAKHGRLQTVELAAALGQKVTFQGKIIARLDPRRLPEDAQADPGGWVASVLDKAIRLVPAVGGMKTAGFGQVTDAGATLTAKESLRLPAVPRSEPGGEAPPSRRFHVTFDRRILVDAQRVALNVRQGRSIIPGAVFKGALAQRLALAGIDPEGDGRYAAALAAVRFSHAFPADKDGKPFGFTAPLSLHLYGEGADRRIACGLSVDGPGRPPPCVPAIPRFATDWKDAERTAVLEAVGWSVGDEPEPLPRGHTAIGAGYIAKDEQLFVDVARSVLRNGEPRPWCLEIHRGDADPVLFAEFLAILREGLDGIGATGARASFEEAPASSWSWPSVLDQGRSGDGLWVVTLATPALMLRDPSCRTPLFEQYAAFWSEHAGGAELVDVFAAQRLTGGYLGKRRRLYGADRYYPFVLTEPGSVFLLRDVPPATLTALLDSGLPAQAPTALVPDATPTWRNCPYLPQNGYGAILVNAVDHAALAGGISL